MYMYLYIVKLFKLANACLNINGFYAISMTFQWNYMASRWNAVGCHGIPWDTEDRIILTVEIHGIWDSDNISEWKNWL